MSTRVLVLGAGGYVGRHLVAALDRSHWAQGQAAVRRLRTPVPNGVQLDATDARALRDALATADVVVNCVAGSADTMIAGAQALREAVDACAHAPRVVHFSSMAVYGPATGTIDDTHALDGSAGPYARAKVAAEGALAGMKGLTVLRPGCIYGPGSPQWTLRIARLLQARRIGDLGAAGDGCSNLVYIDDVVNAVLQAIQLPGSTPRSFNLAMPDAPSWNDYFLAYARVLRAVPLQRIGARRMQLETKILAPALKLLERGLPRVGHKLPPAIPPSLARLWRQDIRLDASAAGRALDLSWTTLAQGLARCSAT